MTMHTNVSGTWKEIPEGYENVAGVWKRLLLGYERVAGVWKLFYAALVLPSSITDSTFASSPTDTTSGIRINRDGTYSTRNAAGSAWEHGGDWHGDPSATVGDDCGFHALRPLFPAHAGPAFHAMPG